jgi:hypothetical protein
MTLPVINVFINFSTGPSFAQAMILGAGHIRYKYIKQIARQ